VTTTIAAARPSYTSYSTVAAPITTTYAAPALSTSTIISPAATNTWTTSAYTYPEVAGYEYITPSLGQYSSLSYDPLSSYREVRTSYPARYY